MELKVQIVSDVVCPWCKTQDMAYSFFDAYFTKNLNLTKREILDQLAQSIGITGDRLEKFWEEDDYYQETIQEEERIRSLGVTGVPFFILEEKYAFSGAQPPNVIFQILEEIVLKESSTDR